MINRHPDLRGCRIGFHGNNRSQVLDFGNPNSANYDIIIIIEEVEKDLGLKFIAGSGTNVIAEPLKVLNQTVAGTELIKAGVSLSAINTFASTNRSAKLFERSGASAIATSSAAVAWALGYPDGSALPEHELVDAVRRITRVLSVPLTVDIEDGYSDDAPKVAALAQKIVDVGAVGINIEDGTKPPALLAEKIERIRGALSSAPLFINARTDVFLRGLAPSGSAVAMTIERPFYVTRSRPGWRAISPAGSARRSGHTGSRGRARSTARCRRPSARA